MPITSCWGVVVGYVSATALFGVILAYFFAFRLYHQKFFLFCAIAWLLNALYIFFETQYINRNITEYEFLYTKIANLVSLPSSFLFLLALKQLHNKRHNPHTVRESICWAFLITLPIIFVRNSYNDHNSERAAFILMVAPGVLFTASVFIRLALHFLLEPSTSLIWLLKTRHSPWLVMEKHLEFEEELKLSIANLPSSIMKLLSSSRALFVISFGLYGALQFCYFLKIDFKDEAWFRNVFHAALLLKVLSGVAITSLVLADFRVFAVIMEKRSSVEELGMLTMSIEHDIRSPLSNIMKKLRMLKAKYQADNDIINAAKWLEDQLEIIRAAADVIPVMRENESSIQSMMETVNVISLMRIVAKNTKNVFLDKCPPIDIQYYKSEIFIRSYRERLLSAFQNIMNNAIEAIAQKEKLINPRIVVRCEQDLVARKAIVVVRDNGIGIADENLDKVFRPMFSTKRKRDANKGVGLFIANRIVEVHGGKIAINSDGSTFTEVAVYLPLMERKRG